MRLHVGVESERDLCEIAIGAHAAQGRCSSFLAGSRPLTNRAHAVPTREVVAEYAVQSVYLINRARTLISRAQICLDALNSVGARRGCPRVPTARSLASWRGPPTQLSALRRPEGM